MSVKLWYINDNILSQDHLQKSSFKKYRTLILLPGMKICNGIFKVDGCICKDYLDKF